MVLLLTINAALNACALGACAAELCSVAARRFAP